MWKWRFRLRDLLKMMEPGFEPRLVWFGNMNCKHCAVATARLLIIKWKYLSSGGTTAYSPGQCIPDFGGTWKSETLIGSSLSGAGMRLGLPGAFTLCPVQVSVLTPPRVVVGQMWLHPPTHPFVALTNPQNPLLLNMFL